MSEAIRLTQYSHGAGCGCKISPKVLEVILAGSGAQNLDPKLWSATPRATTRLSTPLDERGVVPPPISSCRSSTTPSISAVSPRPTPSATSTPWVATR